VLPQLHQITTGSGKAKRLPVAKKPLAKNNEKQKTNQLKT
jgi:hypothetical protein